MVGKFTLAGGFTKLYPSMIANVDIPLPIDENGEISLAAQQEIAAMYDSVQVAFCWLMYGAGGLGGGMIWLP